MQKIPHSVITTITILLLQFCTLNASAVESLKGDKTHADVWNKFAADILNLHKKLIADKAIEVKSRVGGYANNKDFYIERRYYDGAKLISQLQWEKANPDTLHTIEVYVHDQAGRVVRDFSAAYLPHYHNAPTQTLASFHHYNYMLHAFRSFDASGAKVLERCTGYDAKGQQVNILLDEDDLVNDPDGLIGSADYRACFDGLKQQELGKYIIPQ